MDGAYFFNHGLAIVYHRTLYVEFDDGLYGEKGKTGLINRNGELVLDTVYDGISEFQNGFAQIELNGLDGLIDTFAKIVLPIQYEQLGFPFSEGLVDVRGNVKKEAWKDSTLSQNIRDSIEREVERETLPLLEILGEVEKDSLRQNLYFREELKKAIKTYTHDYLCGFLNQDGDTVIDIQFDQVWPLEDGWAKVQFVQTISPTDSISGHNIVNNCDGGYIITENLINKAGDFFFSTHKKKIYYKNRGVIIGIDQNGTQAWDIEKKLLFKTPGQNLHYAGDSLFIEEVENGIHRLLDWSGNQLFEIEAFRLEKITPDRFLVSRRIAPWPAMEYFIVDEKGDLIKKLDVDRAPYFSY